MWQRKSEISGTGNGASDTIKEARANRIYLVLPSISKRERDRERDIALEMLYVCFILSTPFPSSGAWRVSIAQSGELF